MRSFLFPTFLFIGLIITACAASTPTQAPPIIPTPTLIPSPVQGSAVVGQDVEIGSWEYLGPDVVESLPLPSANIRAVNFSHWEARLVRTENGFELVLGGWEFIFHPPPAPEA